MDESMTSDTQRTSETLTPQQQATADALTRVLERGKFVYVVFGVYSDRSGSKILGIYTDQAAADDRVQLARQAIPAYSVNYAKVPLDKTFPVDLNP
jgi:hypothetical protein